MANDNAARPINFKDVANQIMYNVPLFVMEDDATFYVYKNGVYVAEGAEPYLNRVIRSTAEEMNIVRGFPPSPANRKFVAEVFEYIRVQKTVPRGLIGADDHVLNLRNGLLDLRTMEFTSHTSDHYSIVQYPVEYVPDAKCPAIEKFLNEVVLPGDLETLIEYTGYSLVPGNSFKVLAMLYGGRDAGKSTYCNLVESLIGSQYTAHVSPQTMQENKFAQSQLFGKVLNIVPDVGDKPLAGTEAIKTLLGNDEMTADQKYKHGIKFVNKSHIFWGANKTPDIKNDDKDFYDKVLMINFPHCFSGQNANRSMIDEITTASELSGFLNLLISARKRLFNRGRFKTTETGADSRSRYKMESNPVEMFLECHIVASVNDLPKHEMYGYYQKWCALNGITQLPINMFGKRLKAAGFTDSRYRLNGDLKYVWVEVAYVARKPTIQDRLPSFPVGVPGVRVCSGQNMSTMNIDTGEGESEKTKCSRCSMLFPKKEINNDNIPYIGSSSVQNRVEPGTVYTDSDFSKLDVLATSPDSVQDHSTFVFNPAHSTTTVSVCSTSTDDDFHPLSRDILVYIRRAYPDLVVNDMKSFVTGFCKKYPEHGTRYGADYISKLAAILKSRGWRQ